MTRPLDLPRDAQGEVDIQGTMQMITSIIEGWVRERPEQCCGCTGGGDSD